MRLRATRLTCIASAGVVKQALPTLDLNFALTKALDPKITFTRASSGTYVGSDGLIKAAVTNLSNGSQDFSNTYWSGSNAVRTNNSGIAPDGTTTACLVAGSGVAFGALVRKYILFAASTAYSFSCFAKAGTHDIIGLRPTSSATAGPNYCYFNLTTGVATAITPGAGTVVSVSMQPFPNGWYRCAMVYTTPASQSATADVFDISLVTSVGSHGYADTGNVLIWGAQLEQSATVGEYIPTTSTINSAARFTHDPATGESLGLLIEEARTNLVLRSEDFANAAWSKGGVTVTANNAAAPDGTVTADLMLETASPDNHFLNYATAITFTTATQSFYVKPNGRTNVALRTIIGANDWFAVVFNLTGNGSVTQTSTGSSTAFSAVSGTITNAGNGWYRISVTATQPSRTVFAGIVDLCTTSTPTLRAIDGVELYSGDVTKGVYVWGGQVEAGSIPTSYIPTVASTVTRSADVATLTGGNFTSWFNASAGTIYTKARGPVVAGGSQPNIVAFEDTPSTNFILTRVSGTGATSTFFVGVNSTVVAQLASSSFPLRSTFNQASAYALNDFATTVNGGPVATDTLGAVPVVTRAALGSRANFYLNGTIARFTYYPTRLLNAELQALTAS